MSKVICEICGTTYPDTENECPVCGFEKPETAEFAPEDIAVEESAAYNHVKGGRFSKANVSRKATAAAAAVPAKKKKKKKGGSDTGLIIAIIVLLLAIIVTVGYIYIRYFAHQGAPEGTNPPAQTTTEPSKQTLPTQTQGTTEAPDLSCTGLTLDEDRIVLNQLGSRWLLNVVPEPANTTDEITYTSADESIATVSADGEVTPVASGETVITVTCGSVSVECTVVCQLPEETEPEETEPEQTEPEETEPEETEPEETKPQSTFKFNTKYTNAQYGSEVTLNVGETWTAYVGDIDVEDIQWSVGNTSVATVKDGKVRAVGAGYTILRAVYNGVEYTCLINCN